jgi:dUTP pyrophosphatase
MQIKIKRLDQSLPLPQYHTTGSAGFDFYARTTTTIPPKEMTRIPTGLIIATPPGYFLAVINRSSTPQKKGLSMPNGVGVVDSDYCGENDEIKVLMYNLTDQAVTIEKGERIAQGLFLKVEQGQWEEVQEAASKSRGGFGSTGEK